jgi:hypothetical protein
MGEVASQWKADDEAALRARKRRGLVNRVILSFAVAAGFCLFISVLIGAPQSFLGQWWMKPPRYPNAVQVEFAEGEVCLTPAPGVYCYEWYYRTDDSVEDVIAYYEGLEWRFHPQITFEWRRGRRFGLSWVAEANIRVLSNVCGYQIIVHPSSDGDTEIYVLERGAMGSFR